MATVLNDPGCSVSYVNTGTPSCDFAPGPIVWACLLPKNKEFSSSEVLTAAAFTTALQNLCLAAPALRAHPIGQLDNPEDKSSDPIYEETKYGSKIFVRDGKYIWQFSIMNCGVGLLGKLQNFNNTKSYRIIFGDSKNFVFGTKSTAVAGGLKGCGIDNIQFKPWKMSDGSKTTGFMFEVTLSTPSELNEDIAFLKMTSAPYELFKGNIDVVLSQAALDQDEDVTVSVMEAVSGANLYSTYASELAVAGAWVVTKVSTGATVTPASVAADAANEAFIITLTTPDGAHTVSLAAPATLAGLTAPVGGPPDSGFESDVLTVTFAQP